MSLVPTMANALLNARRSADYDLSSMRKIMIGGAAASPELVDRMEKAFHCDVYRRIWPHRDRAAAHLRATKPGLDYLSDADRQRRRAMAGWPFPGCRVRVVDIEHERRARATCTPSAKWWRPAITSWKDIFASRRRPPAVMTGHWLHTGDMGVWDEDGFIHIVDRKKEIIISGGENISSLEVEKAIFAHPEVFECAVVSAPDEKWGEVPVAVVVRKPGSTLICRGVDGVFGVAAGQVQATAE